MFVFANICDFGKLFKLNTKTVWRTTQPALVAVYAFVYRQDGRCWHFRFRKQKWFWIAVICSRTKTWRKLNKFTRPKSRLKYGRWHDVTCAVISDNRMYNIDATYKVNADLQLPHLWLQQSDGGVAVEMPCQRRRARRVYCSGPRRYVTVALHLEASTSFHQLSIKAIQTQQYHRLCGLDNNRHESIGPLSAPHY